MVNGEFQRLCTRSETCYLKAGLRTERPAARHLARQYTSTGTAAEEILTRGLNAAKPQPKIN